MVVEDIALNFTIDELRSAFSEVVAKSRYVLNTDSIHPKTSFGVLLEFFRKQAKITLKKTIFR